jgi:hypothetical protein
MCKYLIFLCILQESGRSLPFQALGTIGPWNVGRRGLQTEKHFRTINVQWIGQ